MESLAKFLESDRFIVLGGHKCGTSSLHAYLNQHPDILMPKIKGQDILNRPRLSIEDYKNSYDARVDQKVFGEVSSVYLYSDRACLSIKKHFPEVKLLAILRNPVDRAFSDFNALPQAKREQFTFEEVAHNPQNFSSLLRNGLYYAHLKRYFETFNPHNIRVFLFDNFVNNQQKFFIEFFEFIAVKSDVLIDTSFVVRKGGSISNKNLYKLGLSKFVNNLIKPIIKPFTTQQQRYVLSKKFKNIMTTKNVLSKDVGSRLTDFYREDILKTQEFLDLDLSSWLNKL